MNTIKILIQRGKKLIICLLLLLGILWLWRDLKPRHAYSTNELYEQVAQMVLKHQKYAKYELSFAPYDFNFDDLIKKVAETDPYLSANIGNSNFVWVQKGSKFVLIVGLDYNATTLELWRSDQRIKALCRSVSHLSDYEKVKAIHDYVILYCEYGNGGRFIDDIENGPYWGLFPGHTTCNGYAMIFYRAMQFLDIPATYETGGDHAWNSVCLDGKWYNMDLTWDDRGGREVSYDYFLKTNSDFAGHHHGNSDAKSSVPVTGPSAEENFRIFPDYKLRYKIHWILNLVVLLALITTVKKIMQKRRAAKRQKWLDSLDASE